MNSEIDEKSEIGEHWDRRTVGYTNDGRDKLTERKQWRENETNSSYISKLFPSYLKSQVV